MPQSKGIRDPSAKRLLALPRSEREQTDESLRLERDRADRALDDEVSEADETADAGPRTPSRALRARRRGVGLGLFISKCIVQGHGGRIWVENRIGPGSTFCFSLPIDAGPETDVAV
jgi:nitrogen fixation/metabolism regulation signal transduction histidine kinase